MNLDLAYKVLITTSGTGSRLGDFTTYTNKALLPLGNKATLSWIIDSYPVKVSFVITLGHFGNHVREYLQIAHPERIFEFVEVENFQGEGSSLALSMLHAESLLQSPFIFHASDTIVMETHIPPPTEDWVLGFKSEEATSYVSFDCSPDLVTKFHPKGWDNYDLLHIGLVGIKSYREFWDCLRQALNSNPISSETNDVSALTKMIESGVKVHAKLATKWFDIGNIGALNSAKKQFPKQFLVLEKKGESIFFVGDRVVKFFADSQVCRKRVERSKILGGIAPEVTAYSEHFYAYKFIQGVNASSKIQSGRVTSILTWADIKLWQEVDKLQISDFQELCNQFYLVKTRDRLNDFYIKSGVKDEDVHINGIKIPKVADLLKELDEEFLRAGVQSKIHGDFILDNLVIHNEEIKAIDWRQDFAGNLSVGDLYYDLAKMMHSFYVNHEVIEKNLFSVDFESSDDKSFYVDILRSNSLIIAEGEFIDWVTKRNLSLKRIQILTALVWLNMAALHHRPFDIFLYFFGKRSLAIALRGGIDGK